MFNWHSDSKTVLFTHKTQNVEENEGSCYLCIYVFEKHEAEVQKFSFSRQVGMVLHLTTKGLNQFQRLLV